MGMKGMSHGMLVVTWKTCGRNLRLRPKHPFLWVLVPAMHSLCKALSTHLLIQVLAAPVCGGSYHYSHCPRLRERKCVCVCMVSCANSAIPRMAHQAPLSMGFPRHKYWNGLPLPPPGDLPDPGIEIRSPALQADSLPKRKPHS